MKNLNSLVKTDQKMVGKEIKWKGTGYTAVLNTYDYKNPNVLCLELCFKTESLGKLVDEDMTIWRWDRLWSQARRKFKAQFKQMICEDECIICVNYPAMKPTTGTRVLKHKGKSSNIGVVITFNNDSSDWNTIYRKDLDSYSNWISEQIQNLITQC